MMISNNEMRILHADIDVRMEMQAHNSFGPIKQSLFYGINEFFMVNTALTVRSLVIEEV